MHKLDEALQASLSGDPDKSFNILSEMQDDPRACFNLGWHMMRLGDFKKGMEGLSYGRALNCFGSPPLETDKPMLTPEILSNGIQNKRILFRSEGGFGDQIINIRFAEVLKSKGCDIIVSCSRSLMRLFLEQHYIDEVIADDGAEYAYFDYWVPAMSAAQILDFDYDKLKDHKSAIQILQPTEYFPLSSNNKNVGIKFKGNPKFEHEQYRKFPEEYMYGVVHANPQCNFYSLDLEHYDRLLNLPMGDWLDTANIVNSLDLVITSCTGVAHLAASLDIETWVVVPIMPYYIWALPGDTSPWYDSVRLFRQEKFGSWEKPFEEIKNAVKSMCESS